MWAIRIRYFQMLWLFEYQDGGADEDLKKILALFYTKIKLYILSWGLEHKNTCVIMLFQKWCTQECWNLIWYDLTSRTLIIVSLARLLKITRKYEYVNRLQGK